MGLFGALGKIAGRVIKGVGGKVAPMLPGGGVIKTAVNIGSKLAKRVGRKNLKRIAAGGAALVGAGIAAGAGRGGGGGGSMVMDPSTGQVMSVGGRRRINPGNVRAMRRAIRRVEAGARLYSKMFRISHGKSIKGAPGVKVVRFKRRAA